MNKVLKKVLLVAAVAIGSVGLVWGILTLVRSANREAVNVYAVSDFMTTDNWGNVSQSSGMVTTDKLQKVFLSSTQTVTEVYVTEGQSVKKGDKLLAYDTTLSALDLQMAQIQLERKEMALEDLKKELSALKKAKNKWALQVEQSVLQSQLEQLQSEISEQQGGSADDSIAALLQDGTLEKPFYVKGDRIDPATLPGRDPSKDCHVVLYSIEDGMFTTTQGVILNADGTIGFFFPEPISVPVGSGDPLTQIQILLLQKYLEKIGEQLATAYTPLELLLQQKEMQEQIGEAEVELKLATLDLQRKQSEMEDGVVYSTLDGTVKVVRDETDAFQNSEAMVEISGGGGYYVSGVISELDLANIHIGDTVQINSWMTGTNCEGEIVSLEEYPSEQSGWGGGNNNVSYYPFQAFVSEEVSLQENDYVDITYQSSGSRDSWYLENMFIRTENGKNYVYVRGENGTLEQRWITTGSSLWGSYTEIRGGLTQDDYIAFPYGKDVTVGAKTQEATPDQLYGY